MQASRSRWLVRALLDTGIVLTAYIAAWSLRFGDDLPHFVPFAKQALPFVVAAQLAALAAAGAWRSTRGGILLRVAVAIVLGSIAGAAVVFLGFGGEGLSRTALILDVALAIAGCLTWRAVRMLWRMARPEEVDAIEAPPGMESRLKPVSLGLELVALYRYRSLLRAVVMRDLKLKYRGSVFGALWSLVNPLLMTTVYVIAFSYILQIRTVGFVLYLLLGQLAWMFFVNSAGMSTGAIVDSGGLVKSVYFPRTILPVGTVLFNLAQYVLTMTVMMPILLAYYQVPLGTQMLAYPVVLFLQVVFTTGLALLLSSTTALFRDVRHLLEVALSALFWLTPIVYEVVNLPDRLRLPILLSPVSSYIEAYHQIFYYGNWPDATVWFVATVYAAVSIVAGATVFLAHEQRFAEQI